MHKTHKLQKTIVLRSLRVHFKSCERFLKTEDSFLFLPPKNYFHYFRNMKKRLFLLIVLILFVHCKNSDNNQLDAMNNIEMPQYEELRHPSSSKEVLKILIVGNSITSHGKASDIGWNHKSGMAAIQESKDYVHLLFDKLSSQYPTTNILLRYSNWSQFERSPETFSGFKSAEEYNPDIIIFQLSDNITPESSDHFCNASISFLKRFKNKFVVSPFFMNASNYVISTKIAKDSNSTFIDISSISKDKTNRASNDIRSDKSEWKVEGISQHPGNIGMINISNTIFNHVISQGR